MYTPTLAASKVEKNHFANEAVNTYAKIGLETAVLSASPHQLITMLFDGAQTAIYMARHHMRNNEIAAKGKAITKAINIVENGLKSSLDAKAGGKAGAQLVTNLAALYDYIVKQLMLANLRNDPALLDEAERLLESVGSAWREIDGKQGTAVPSL
ncbi:flagellar export chaperone FliS [Glaciimonas soli]|uniref:Flagellar secretion chaperone FliS n=1 Tax=Glaciimonas soli TaxID=2590999 RepID=A0A843YN78_9BURK|nr:flagellar export chaperone FliS [Glaciimonas soli]MQQ99436.1 flagellar export chaperone FliS [Glaciimonas soli]